MMMLSWVNDQPLDCMDLEAVQSAALPKDFAVVDLETSVLNL